MSDKVLYIALVVSVLGLFILAFASEVLEPPLSRVSDIGTNSVGKQVHVRGSVSKVYSFKGGSATLTLSDGSADIIVYIDYSTAKAKPSILTAKYLDIVGEVDEYKGALEVKPKNSDSVKILS